MPGKLSAPWLDVAWAELGVAERPGPAADPAVVGYYREAGHGEVTDDGVPWCAAFVGACLKRAGIRPTGSLMARSYTAFGHALSEPKVGAIAVLSRGGDPSSGHVGFVVGNTSAQVLLLGGNQGDAVSIAAFDRSRVVALRWPDAARADTPAEPPPPPSDVPQAADNRPAPSSSTTFDAALAHVLDMEGGFTDDPHDPGGATNFGITIADLASWRGETVTADSYGRLRAELKAIPRATVVDIYRERYWQPSHADDLTPALAFMHFDAAVNHGLGGAARMLQATLGVAVDGQIGPLTLAAARSADPLVAIEKYAELRRARYRALPHYWRFGRGWLRRVDATCAAAKALGADPPTAQSKRAADDTPPPSEEDKTMPVDTQPTAPAEARTPVSSPPVSPPAAKWWGQSMTIWGAIITATATVLPVLAPALRPLLGFDLTPDLVRQTAVDMVAAGQALAGVIGTVMTIWGRFRAASRLETRAMMIRI